MILFKSNQMLNQALKVKEKRIGFIPMKSTSRKSHQRRSSETFVEFSLENASDIIDNERSKRPIRLLPLHLF